MIEISSRIQLSEDEIELTPIRAQGAGGQNVNKVSTAIHLRFNISTSSLPESYKERLLKLNDRRISHDGILIIKAQRYRSQEKNREDAIERLIQLIQKAAIQHKKRVPTKPTRAAKARRVDEKNKRGKTKNLRRKVIASDH